MTLIRGCRTDDHWADAFYLDVHRRTIRWSDGSKTEIEPFHAVGETGSGLRPRRHRHFHAGEFKPWSRARQEAETAAEIPLPDGRGCTHEKGNIHMSGLCRVSFVSLAAVLLTLTFQRPLRAADNPFGMPDPREGGKAGTVILHGGGQEASRARFRKTFIELCKEASGKERLVLFMPSDLIRRGYYHEDDLQNGDPRVDEPIEGGESREEFEGRLAKPWHYGSWKSDAEEAGLEFKFIYHDELKDHRDAHIVSALKRAVGIWFNAYDQTWLPGLFDSESAVVEELRDLLARGGVIGALGGAMSSLPETIIGGDKGDGDGGWILPDLTFGMGLLDGVVVDKDFTNQSGRLERLAFLLRNGPRHDPGQKIAGIRTRTIGLGVSHDTAAILKENTVEALSAVEEGSVSVFVPSNGGRTITWHRLSSGQRLTINRVAVSAQNEKVGGQVSRNPFGLPEKDGAPKGRVVLHGGGATDDMYELLPRLSGVKTPHLVHCSAASDDLRPVDVEDDKLIKDYLENYLDVWANLKDRGIASDVTFITTRPKLDPNRDELVGPLRKANALWFSGGNQNRLSDYLISKKTDPPTRFEAEVKGILLRGGVIGGTSAGLAILPSIVISPDDTNAENCELRRGFGVLQNVLADQHFDARHGRIKRLSDLIWSDRKDDGTSLRNLIGLAVEERTSAILENDRISVRGTQHVHLLLNCREGKDRCVAWHVLRPGDSGTVISTDAGYVFKLDDWQWQATR